MYKGSLLQKLRILKVNKYLNSIIEQLTDFSTTEDLKKNSWAMRQFVDYLNLYRIGG